MMNVSEEALKIHQESIIIDGHCDSIGREIEGQRMLKERSELGQWDFQRAMEGGLTCQLLATFMNMDRAGRGARQTFQFIDVFHQGIEENADIVMQAVNAEDIVKAKQTGKLALMLSMEGAEGLEGDLRILRTSYRLGLRCLGLTWNRRNEAADGMYDKDTGGGLSTFGKSLVQECSRLGILLDIAHLSPRGVEDLFEVYDGPIICTHANSYALCPHQRNLMDETLVRIAERGGVVGVTTVPPFLELNKDSSSLDIILDHIDHMVGVMGEDGVAFSGDFDGVGDLRVEGLEDVTKLPNLTQGLLDRGYQADTIKKILGGNFLRVFSQL